MRHYFCYNAIVDFDAKAFQTWIQNKFAEWRGKRRESLANYAKYIGVSPQVMSNWWNGSLKERPNPKQYNLLVKKYGFEVYDVLGLPRPSENDFLSSLPPEISQAVAAAREEIEASGFISGNDTASPEDVEKIRAILLKHLGKYQDKT